LAHVSDIYASMAFLAGAHLVAHDSKKIGMGAAVDGVPTDGFNLWPAIGSNGESPRKEIVHQPLNTYWNATCKQSDISNPFTPSCAASITLWPFKLFVGFPGDHRVVRLKNTSLANSYSAPTKGSTDACVTKPCLYNIEVDASEVNDLAAQKPDVVDRLVSRLKTLSAPEAQPQPADALTPDPPDEACRIVETTGAWMPWSHDEGASERSLLI